MIEDREIVYDLFQLSYPVRVKLLIGLNLVEPYSTDDDVTMIKNALRRAKDVGIIEQLKTAINSVKENK